MAEKTSLAGERFEEEEVAEESFDKVFVNDIIKLINGSGIRNIKPCICIISSVRHMAMNNVYRDSN